MMLHSRALDAFIAVAEELHFGHAAKRLHVSQPPLSQQIRRFEAQVGASLFVRSTRSVKLTPAGAVLLRKARQLVADGQAAIHAAQRAAAGGSGHLSVGFTSTAAYQLLPKLLAGCHGRRPDIQLSLREDLSTHLIEMLAEEKIDIALLRRPAATGHDSLVFTRVSRENMCVALPLGHPYAGQERIAPQQLHGVPFIGFNAEAALYFRERIQSIFAHFQIQPAIVHESVMPTLLALVEAGMGIALVPGSASCLRPEGVCFRPLDDDENVAAIDLYCAQRRVEENPAVDVAREILRSV